MRLAVSTLLLATAFGLAPARAQTPAGQVKLDVVGTFDITFERQGHTQPAVIQITRAPDGKLGGTLDVHEQLIHFTAVTLEARKLTLVADAGHANGPLTMTLNFITNDRVEGSFAAPEPGNGSINGTRRAERR